MPANFAAHRSSHTIKYKKVGDYGKEVPHVVPVVHQDGMKVMPGTCEVCAFNSTGPHSKDCVSIEASAIRMMQRL